MSNGIKITSILSVTAVVCALVCAMVISSASKPQQTQIQPLSGLTEVFQGTTTPLATDLTLLKTGAGVLHNVSVVAPNTGVLYFYDATTSNVNLRTNNTASTSLIVFSLPAAATSTDHLVDVGFYNGLLMDYVGTPATTTVSWR